MCLKLRHQRWFGWIPAVSDRETAPFKPVHRVSFLPVRPTVSWVRCFIHLDSLGGNLLLGLQKDEHHPKKFLRIFISLNLRPTGRSKAFLRGNSSYRKVQSVAKEADGGAMEPLSCFTFRVQWRSVHVDVSNLEADSRWVGDTSRGLPGSQVDVEGMRGGMCRLRSALSSAHSNSPPPPLSWHSFHRGNVPS